MSAIATAATCAFCANVVDVDAATLAAVFAVCASCVLYRLAGFCASRFGYHRLGKSCISGICSSKCIMAATLNMTAAR